MSKYATMFSPITIGRLEVKNRVFMSPHGMVGLGIGTDRQVGYFEARAKGGAGFMVIASCQVVPAPLVPPGWFIEAYNPEHIPAIRRIVDAAHKHGAKIAVQGVWMMADPDKAQASAIAPHTVLADTQPRSMTTAEVHELIEAHAVAASHAEQAGADGFEFPINAGGGLQSFTSEFYNQRTDEYGGSLPNRMRIVTEIIAAIRQRVRADFAIGVAVNADESTLGASGIDDGIAQCKILEDTGMVDWLRITARGQKPQMTQYHYPSSYMGREGTHLDAAEAVKKAVKLPVVSGGRILTPAFADQAIADGRCDMVFVARSVIADPEWPNKCRDDKTAEIRACIGDLEGCFLRSCVGQAVGCTVNPEIGHEYEGPITPAATSKNVVIVGAGPAGLQAALVASQRGHKVTVLEKSDTIGGHVTMQALLPGLEDRAELIRWLKLQLDKAGVPIHTNMEATPESVKALQPDAVIIATGARYSKTGASKAQLTGVPGAHLEHVFTPEEVLLEHARIGKRIVVYDNTSYEVGPGIAEHLANQGKEVFLVTIDSAMAMSVTELGLNKVIARRVIPKVTFLPSTEITAIDESNVSLRGVYSGETSVLEGIDNTILVTSKPPQEDLYHAMVGDMPNIRIIGDAREARWSVFATDEAIKDGRRAALLI
ncbi:FAD-dependent oxidoreductase [Novosphingobium sp. CECT 9465]|uniref:FAD-dependent oxidoreductase n=1 Tax=Novosphingobium sp. CECT 9465 TaxID=2829794 RepID=UPI001E4185B6|nr:FAD-dependent oxidoreductase [Novosphingobium sp. CECT 9465]CAH0495407.1 Cinnamate reductase [Novosphingobium sp. CECT 9465]